MSLYFLVYTMKVHGVQCCFGPHSVSSYGQKQLILCSIEEKIIYHTELFSFLVEYPHLRKLILCPDMWYMPDEVMQTVRPSLGVKLESNLIMFLLKETHIT